MELKERLEKHSEYRNGEEGGERFVCEWREDFSGADLRGADLRGAYLGGANLWGADLTGADLGGAYLRGADLRGAYLRGADLRGANLRGAYLRGANLWGADLTGADLGGADLRGAYLTGADLTGADLTGADLWGADLTGADLRSADLTGADLWGADLRSANNIPNLVYGMTLIATPEIRTGWKKLSGGLICKLEIPAEAKRSNATGRKCRCEYAKVLEIWDGDKQVQQGYTGIHAPRTEYIVGEIVLPDKWDDDRWNECSNGIHFFLTRVEAENY